MIKLTKWVASCVRCGRGARIEATGEKVVEEIAKLWRERHGQQCDAVPIEGREGS